MPYYDMIFICPGFIVYYNDDDDDDYNDSQADASTTVTTWQLMLVHIYSAVLWCDDGCVYTVLVWPRQVWRQEAAAGGVGW